MFLNSDKYVEMIRVQGAGGGMGGWLGGGAGGGMGGWLVGGGEKRRMTELYKIDWSEVTGKFSVGNHLAHTQNRF